MKLKKLKEKKDKVKVKLEFTSKEFEILRNNGIEYYEKTIDCGKDEYVLELYADKNDPEDYLTKIAQVSDLFWEKKNKKIIDFSEVSPD